MILLQNPHLLPKNELSEVRCHMASTRAGMAQGRRFIIDFDGFFKHVFFAQKEGVLQQNLFFRPDPKFLLTKANNCIFLKLHYMSTLQYQ